MNDQRDFEYIVRTKKKDFAKADELFNIKYARIARSFHRQIPGYKMTSLKSLANLAHMIGLEGIYIKDESERLHLNSFKVMGGSFAIARFIQKKLGLSDEQLTYASHGHQ